MLELATTGSASPGSLLAALTKFDFATDPMNCSMFTFVYALGEERSKHSEN